VPQLLSRPHRHRRGQGSRRQVFYVPPINVHVTERQVINPRLRVRDDRHGHAPAEAGAPVQYGPVTVSKELTDQAIGDSSGLRRVPVLPMIAAPSDPSPVRPTTALTAADEHSAARPSSPPQ